MHNPQLEDVSHIQNRCVPANSNDVLKDATRRLDSVCISYFFQTRPQSLSICPFAERSLTFGVESFFVQQVDFLSLLIVCTCRLSGRRLTFSTSWFQSRIPFDRIYCYIHFSAQIGVTYPSTSSLTLSAKYISPSAPFIMPPKAAPPPADFRILLAEANKLGRDLPEDGRWGYLLFRREIKNKDDSVRNNSQHWRTAQEWLSLTAEGRRAFIGRAIHERDHSTAAVRERLDIEKTTLDQKLREVEPKPKQRAKGKEKARLMHNASSLAEMERREAERKIQREIETAEGPSNYPNNYRPDSEEEERAGTALEDIVTEGHTWRWVRTIYVRDPSADKERRTLVTLYVQVNDETGLIADVSAHSFPFSHSRALAPGILRISMVITDACPSASYSRNM